MSIRIMGSIVLLGMWGSALGCGPSRFSFNGSPEEGISSEPDTPVTAYSCDGLCVQTAPATFTGPSLFWIGPATAIVACPPSTPLLGIEGWIGGDAATFFARECRITPSDRCASEGLVCAPMPDADFHVCIHHNAESSCPPDYPERSTMSELTDDATVTLCCQESPISG